MKHKVRKIHFIGIGGISMSGLAEILLDRGFTVTGSDNVPSPLTEHLTAAGARISFPQSADNVTGDIDIVVYTAAIHPDNPEYAACEERGLPMLTRAQLLGQIMSHYEESVAVAGTHGKTTTTGMIGEVLLSNDRKPTISIGGIFPSIGGNICVGDSDLFLTEACEYTNSFLSLHPRVGIILNIEEDHLDFFENLPKIHNKVKTLQEVGLGYIKLGQPSTTLSGGESQRVKLATELAKRDTGRTVYILDEPTTGLHFEDIRVLLGLLQQLVDKGNTVIVIEHNLDVIKSADYLIDMGPEGGRGGGQLVVCGTPEQVVKSGKGYTAEFLKDMIRKGEEGVKELSR